MAVSQSANSDLGQIIRDGVALDVFRALQAQRLIEELDEWLEIINRIGVGKSFFARLQPILEQDLRLSIVRMYEIPAGYPLRTIPAAIRLIESRAGELELARRDRILNFLQDNGESPSRLEIKSDEQLSVILANRLDEHVPRHNRTPARSIDQAFAKLRTVRNKRDGHYENVVASSIIDPSWPSYCKLVEIARTIVELISVSYLDGNYDFDRDASKAASSLHRLIEKAGLSIS